MSKRTHGDVCSYRHSFSLDNFLRKLIQSPKRIVGPYIEEGDTVIDLGCGPGFFTVPIAEMVGDTGRVVAVDLQEEMLTIVTEKLFDTHLANRVTMHQCDKHALNLDPLLKADFILAYYMVHETPDQGEFFREVKGHLKPEGKVLVVEPPFHVNRRKFTQMKQRAEAVGFAILDTPKRKGGSSLLLSH